MPRGAPSLDMTPMVDLAFLLVTFFMLTATVRVDEPVVVDAPSSTSDKILPNNTMIITVSADGKAFYNIDNPEVRIKTLDRMAQQYKITFTDEEKKRFGAMTSFGVPINSLKQYINMDEAARVKSNLSTGIPMDSLNNQLGDWILYGYSEAGRKYNEELNKAKIRANFKGEKMRIAIKGDAKADYIIIQEIVNIIKKKNIEPRLNFITNLEEE